MSWSWDNSSSGVDYNNGDSGQYKPDSTDTKNFDGGSGCRRCGVEGHFAAACPDKPACYNCGETGHSNKECEQPRGFKGTCRVCSKEGHTASECPDKPEFNCYNCGETGHSSKNCEQPRVFKGTCRVCSKEGHPASDCPDKPAIICRNCQKEGHTAASCDQARNIHNEREGEPIQTLEECWLKMTEADANGDLEEFREHLMKYSQACPEVTFRELEEAFRGENFRVHLIAMETQLIGNKTLVNLQGQQDQKYVVKLQLGGKPKRSGLVGALIAHTAEENLARLDEAGFIMDGYKPYCSRCKQTGHIVKSCPQEKPEVGEKKDETTLRERPVASTGVWSDIN